MTEIDLAPRAFHEYQRLRGIVRLAARAAVVMLVVIVGCRVGLGLLVDGERKAMEALRADEKEMLAQQSRYEQLLAQEQTMRKQLTTLAALRGGPLVETVFAAVDRSISDEVWFTEWRFVRADMVEPASGQKEGGSFLIMPADRREQNGDWRQRTRMEIRGQATEHSYLAAFVSALLRQPGIADVIVRQSRRQSGGKESVVDFELVVPLLP